MYGCQCLGFLTGAQLLMHVIAHGDCTNTVRESALKADIGREKKKIPCRTEESAFRSNALPTDLRWPIAVDSTLQSKNWPIIWTIQPPGTEQPTSQGMVNWLTVIHTGCFRLLGVGSTGWLPYTPDVSGCSVCGQPVDCHTHRMFEATWCGVNRLTAIHTGCFRLLGVWSTGWLPYTPDVLGYLVWVNRLTAIHIVSGYSVCGQPVDCHTYWLLWATHVKLSVRLNVKSTIRCYTEFSVPVSFRLVARSIGKFRHSFILVSVAWLLFIYF